MDVLKTILEKLKGLEYELLEHDFVHTSEDAAKVRKTSLKCAAKAIVLKADNKNIMCVLPGDKKIDFKTLKKLEKIKNLRLEDPNKVLEITNCKIGTVPPLGNLFGIKTILDEDLLNSNYLVFSAGSHYKSIKLTPLTYLKIENPQILSFSSLK